MTLLGFALCTLAAAGALYAVLAAIVAGKLLISRNSGRPPREPAVSILKPLHGVSAGLEGALASNLTQAYGGPVQVVLGLHHGGDPAATVAERVAQAHAEADIAVAVNAREYGASRKVSNLINMLAAAKHDILIVSDADIEVPADWLSAIATTLSRPDVGAASCFYIGAGEGYWQRLAAMGISYQFLPNALVGVATGLAHPCFGSTIAMTRKTLTEIGGFELFANVLADDYEIGRAVREKGYRLAYPPLLVKHVCGERSLGDLWRHELRWARTIRLIDPLGHWGSVVTHALPLGLIGAALLGFSPAGLVILATVAAARLFLKYRIDHIAGASAGPAWLLPVRDMLSFVVFLASLTGREVDWQGERLKIGARGAISQGG